MMGMGHLPSPNSSSSMPLATLGTYGLTSNGVSTAVSLTSASGTDAFSLLGLHGSSSENWTNWSTYEPGNISAPTSFSLYAFAVDVSLGQNWVTIAVSGVQDGSYVGAAGCEASTVAANSNDGSTYNTTTGIWGVCSGAAVGQSVFTNTVVIDTSNNSSSGGNTGTVPEPASVALMAVGLLGLALVRARPRRQ